MKKLLIFTAGLAIGLSIDTDKIIESAFPFVEKCTILDCKYRTFSSKPHVVLRDMDKHMRKVHPGWIKK